MPQFSPLPPFQQSQYAGMREEPFNHDNVPTMPPITTAPLYAPMGQPATEQLQTVTQSQPLYQPRNTRTEQLEPFSGPLEDLSTAPSLLDALQATMSTRATTQTRIVVIPGAKKQTATLPSPTKARRIPPKLRIAITLGSILAVMVMTLLSLAPLDNGQSGLPFFGSVMQWAKAQQQNWTIMAHMMPAAQSAPAAPAAPVVPAPVTLPQSQYIAIARQDALNAGISPDYFVRQINQESGFNPNAVSPAGAVGIAQFEPSTAAGLGIDPWNPIQALNAAAHLMASYANQYGGDYAKALAAYNAGSGTVQYAVNTCGTVNWMNCLPAETRNYIQVIMGI